MCFHQGLAYGESKTQASELSPAALFERIENLRQRFRLNPQACISDFDAKLSAGIIAGGNYDSPIRLRKLYRVIYQVPKDLLQSRRVCSHMHLACAKVERTCQMLAIDFRLANLQRILQ